MSHQWPETSWFSTGHPQKRFQRFQYVSLKWSNLAWFRGTPILGNLYGEHRHFCRFLLMLELLISEELTKPKSMRPNSYWPEDASRNSHPGISLANQCKPLLYSCVAMRCNALRYLACTSMFCEFASRWRKRWLKGCMIPASCCSLDSRWRQKSCLSSRTWIWEPNISPTKWKAFPRILLLRESVHVSCKCNWFSFAKQELMLTKFLIISYENWNTAIA